MMSKVVALVVFCGLCASVFSDDDPNNCIFDFESFTPEPDSDDVVVDYSGQRIATLIEGGRKYNYITGPLKVKSAIDNSFSVDFVIQQLPNGQVARGTQDACYFSESFYPQYLTPIQAKHSDITPNFSICKVEPGTTLNLFPANNTMDLTAPSQLEGGRYYFELTFLQGFNSVGGMRGIFNLLRN